MDPSTWMEYTSAAQQAYSQHLLASANSAQLGNANGTHHSHQFGSHHHHHQGSHQRNIHHFNHMATTFGTNNVSSGVNCQKATNIDGASLAKNSKQLVTQQMTTNMNPMVPTNHDTGQSMMNGNHHHHHYNTGPTNNSSWFFNSRQQHPGQDSSLQVRNHPERGNPSSSTSSAAASNFNHTIPFGIHSAPNGVYDPNSFMSSTFHHHQQQQTKSTTNYLPSMAAANGFISNIGKKPDSEMNFRNNSYCSSMKMSSMTCPNHSGTNGGGVGNNPNLGHGTFFNAHSLTNGTTNPWHHPHSQHHSHHTQTNLPSNNGTMFPQDTVNMINTQNVAAAVAANNTTTNFARSYSTSRTAYSNDSSNSINGFCNNKMPCNTNGKQVNNNTNHDSNHQQTSHNHMNNVGHHHHNHHSQYKNTSTNVPSASSTPTPSNGMTNHPFGNMSLNSNNSYLMQSNFPKNGTTQNSTFNVDPTSFGAKFAAAAAHHQAASDYASLAFAAAINTEYANYHQHQAAQKHQQQYMNNFASNGSGSASSNLHHHHQHSSNDSYSSMPYDSNGLINYHCTPSLFPMTGTDGSMNTATTATNMKLNVNTLSNEYHSNGCTNGQSNVPASTHTMGKSRKGVSNQKQRQQQQSNYKADQLTNGNMTTNQSFNESFNLVQTNLMNTNGNCLVNGSTTTGNNNNNVSRCSSVASNHQIQHNSNDSYSYNYSPATTTNLSAHSPYQQRSSTSNSSHSSGASCALTNNGDYLNYGTPNSVSATVFPQTIGNSQTPTPTPGYPTPPSSVGQSNSRCNSNEELSPYSNNSMSSSISQPFNRADYKSNSNSSQISPKQMDPNNSMGSAETLSFNSACMVAASQKGSTDIHQSKHMLTVPDTLYDSNHPMDDTTYNKQQQQPQQQQQQQQFPVSYQSHLSSSAPASTCSNELYMNYGGSDNTSMQINGSMENNVQECTNGMDDSYDYHHYDQTDNGQYESEYSDKTGNLSACSQQQQQQPEPNKANSSHVIESIEQESKNQYQNGHESFNLNFDSVIQPIDVNMTSVQSDIHHTVTNGDNMNGLAPIDLPDDDEEDPKSTFPSIDELNFISSHSQPNPNDHCGGLSEKHSSYSMVDTDQSNTNNQMAYQSSQENAPAPAETMESDTSMECNNIQSIIDSLPKSNEDDDDDDDCLQSVAKNELMVSRCGCEDNFLSDLAPLMNDNSKIALMESTFKSMDNSTTIDHTKDLVLGIEKINKDIFDDDDHSDLKIGATLDYVSTTECNKHATVDCDVEPVDNRLKDVDDFLEDHLPLDVQTPVSVVPSIKSDSHIPQHQLQQTNIHTESSTTTTTTTSTKSKPKTNGTKPCKATGPKSQALKSSNKISTNNNNNNDVNAKKVTKKTENRKNTLKNVGCELVQSIVNHNSNNNKNVQSSGPVPKTLPMPTTPPQLPPQTTMSSTSKFFKRKANETSATFDNEDCTNIKKRKIAVVMPKSKECKKPTVPMPSNSEYDFLEKKTIKLNNKTTKKTNSSNRKTTLTTANNETMKTVLTAKTSKTTTTQTPKESISKTKNDTSTKSKANNKVVTTKPTKSKTVQIKKSVAEIAPNKSVNVAMKTSVKSTEKIVSMDMMTNTIPMIKLQPLTVDTSPNSLSEVKENVASINTSNNSVIGKSKPTVASKSDNIKTKLETKPTLKPAITVAKTELKSPAKVAIKSVKPKPTSLSSPSMSNNRQQLAKKNVISPKPACLGTNGGPILSQASLLNATCLNKSVNSTNFNLTSPANVAPPTLIVNQNAPVNSYQVSPVTNAVLISIHPANGTPIQSLTAPSTFITLNAPTNVSSTVSNTTTSTTSSSNTTGSSRRRSQDKKVATIREGLMRTSDFVVSEDEAHLEWPVIWRIEGKSLLQRFEPSEQNGVKVYINTSSYSAWNPTVRQKYLGLDVRIMGCNRTRIVVEKLSLTRSKSTERSDSTNLTNEKDQPPTAESLSPSDISSYLENFEVFIQTLISQALDSNFISDIVKDNDEYFLSHMQTIGELFNKRRSRFISIVKWEPNILKCIETYPEVQTQKQSNVGDLRCRICLDNWSTKILQFEGTIYDMDSLETTVSTESRQTKFPSCDSCTDRAFLYSRLHHQKYNFFKSCKSKVEAIQAQDENKESPIILDECLQDGDWIRTLFGELESIIHSCDNLR